LYALGQKTKARRGIERGLEISAENKNTIFYNND
jgi:hypothetical protein